MKEVKFELNTLKVINELSYITEMKNDKAYPIKISKDSKGIHIRAGNPAKSVIFTLDAPTEHFDFDGDEICFYNYQEFYRYVSLFEEPKMNQDFVGEGVAEAPALVIFKDKKKVNYPLSDSEVIRGSIKNINWEEPDAIFVMTNERSAQIRKVLSLLGNDIAKVKLSFEGKELSICAYTSKSSNSYEDKFELDNEVEEEFELVITSEVFKYLLNVEHRVEVNKDGYVRFFFNLADISASILATSIDEV